MNSEEKKFMLIFDLDGLILDSLSGLSRALEDSLKDLLKSESAFARFRNFDNENPGVSRFRKIEFALDLVGIEDYAREEQRREILKRFEQASLDVRSRCEIDTHLPKFTSLDSRYFELALVSNCDSEQLKKIS